MGEDGKGSGIINETEIARLAALHPLEYDRQRQAAADKLGCRLSSLDKPVEIERTKHFETVNAVPQPGRKFEVREFEPWDESVDGVELLTATTRTVKTLMSWCVGNAKIEMRGDSIYVTKTASGTAKIDALMATFCAVEVMSRNPESMRSVYEDRGLLVI